MESHIYNVNITWNEDRKGVMCSPELSIGSQLSGGCIEVATPPQFPKGMPGIWSPEHLFTAAVSSCLMTTFLSIAENSKLNFRSFRCASEGKLEKMDGKLLMTEVLLKPTVTITDEKEKDKALRVLQKSESNCLISNSVKAKVVMQPSIEVEVVSVA
ncbi:MAG: OsmC family protein [Bacteroidetes bacterium]|nr:OsmC family protein [Bacteroidota bacterium]